MNEYTLCVICSKPLGESLAALAVRRLERMSCGLVDCIKKDEVRTGRLCCEKATYTLCSCARSYTCPDHGDVHVGTHD